MAKKLLPALAALFLLALSLGTALAHESREDEVEGFNFVVGFLVEPAYEGSLNGVSLRVTKPAEEDAHDHSAHDHGEDAHEEASEDDHADHDHSAHGHDAIESAVPISIRMIANVEDNGGVNISLTADGFRWTPENVDGPNVDGEGHGHVYVDGVKVGRMYGPHYHLTGLEPGERELRVTLNANAHNEMTYNGEHLEAIETITVPESSHGMEIGHTAPVDADSAMSIDVNVPAEADGAFNLQVVPRGFTFAPQNIGGTHKSGEGYAVVSVNGEDYTRMYTDWIQMDDLGEGTHTVEVRLVSNDHFPYAWDGDTVKASTTVHVHAAEVAHAAMESEVAAPEDDHHAEPVPVEGIEQTLLVEVTHIPTGASRVMTLHAEFDKPGYYKANFIPTASGQYAFHFKGKIEGVPIDERFESGPGRFDDVQPATDLQFPVSAASTRELESAVRGALDSAQQAQDAALRIEAAAMDAQNGIVRATTMAMVGIAVGAVGIVVGAVGAFAALRRRN
ncbi:MAG: hypothetical protein OXG80_09650 [Chloroflexi bacterium]|nr:hypothetical protein [Chloroflexota bacterium]